MKEQPIKTLDPRTSRIFRVTRWSALLSLAMLLGCDKTLLVGAMAMVDDPDAGGQVLAGGTGGTASTSTLGTGGVVGTTTVLDVKGPPPPSGGASGAGGAGGAGGTKVPTITPITITAGTSCAPISTVPGILNPCGHSFGVAYSPDGQILAVGMDSSMPSVRLWRLSDGTRLPDLDLQTADTTYNLTFSPDGKTLVTAGYLSWPGGNYLDDSSSALLRLWDVSTGALIRSLPVDTGFYADTVAFTRDGALLATGGYGHEVEIWRVADGTRVLGIAIQGTAHNVHFSPDDSKLITATTDGKAKIWDVTTGALILDKITVTNEMADADFSPDGQQIASTGDGNVVRIWNATSGELLQTLGGYHSNYISHVVWIDENRLVSDDWQGGVVLWARSDSGSFAALKVWSTGGQALGIGVSPDKTTIVTGGANPANIAQPGFVFLSL